MAAAEVANSGYGWQSPRISFGIEANAENGWQSPRISFSVDLSLNDRLSPDSSKREIGETGSRDVPCDSEFEFCLVGATNADDDKHLLLPADELFGGGKILPLMPESDTNAELRPSHESEKNTSSAPLITIARHLSLESSSRNRSPVRSSSYPPTKSTITAVPEKNASKIPPKTTNKWRDMFRLSKDKSSRADDANEPHSSSQKSRWKFSRSCNSSSGETKFSGGGLLCSLPFARSYSSTAERKNKSGPGVSVTCYRSISVGSGMRETGTGTEVAPPRPDFASDSKQQISETHSRDCQTDRKAAMRLKSKTYCGRSRNLDRCSIKEALASPLPGKPIAEGNIFFQKRKSNSKGHSGFGGAIGINPVLNVPVCIGPNGGKNGSGLFVLGTLFHSKTQKDPRNTRNKHEHA